MMSSSDSNCKLSTPKPSLGKVTSSDTSSVPLSASRPSLGKLTSSDTSSVPTDLTISSAEHSEAQSLQKSKNVPQFPHPSQNVPKLPQLPHHRDVPQNIPQPSQKSQNLPKVAQNVPQPSHLSNHQQLSRIQHQLSLTQQESIQKDALIQKLTAEHKLEVERLEDDVIKSTNARKLTQAKLEAQLQIQAKEVEKVQESISQQLGMVIQRQKGLEAVNGQLRERADIAKQKLEEFEYEPEEYTRLCRLPIGDMSLFEFSQFLIYKHVEPQRERVTQLEKVKEDLGRKIDEEKKESLKCRIIVDRLKEDNGSLKKELKMKDGEVGKIRETVKEIDSLNAVLQEKIVQQERGSVEIDALIKNKNEEIQSYRKQLSELGKTVENSVQENKKLHDYIKNIDQEFLAVNKKCHEMDQKSGLEMSNLSSWTKTMQKKQVELLEQLSGSIVQNNLDQGYRDQYLGIIRQLVAEQVRTQQYIAQISAERDESLEQNTQLQAKVKKTQMDLMEEELKKQRESEKVVYLEQCLQDIEVNNWKSGPYVQEKETKEIKEVEPKETVIKVTEDVKNSEEYLAVLKDLQLLLSHRKEISEMKYLLTNLQNAA